MRRPHCCVDRASDASVCSRKLLVVSGFKDAPKICSAQQQTHMVLSLSCPELPGLVPAAQVSALLEDGYHLKPSLMGDVMLNLLLNAFFARALE